MRDVRLTHCLINDFRSFESAEIDFPPSAGFRFLGGDNKVDTSLGANGAGKSTLWDAVFWCLWGVSVKGFKAAELTRWGADKCFVLVQLLIDSKAFTIKRESAPMRIWINDALAPQEEVTELVGLSAEQARHSVFFGQGTDMLPDLSLGQRAELLDSVLGLGLWARLGERHGQKAYDVTGRGTSPRFGASRSQGQARRNQRS